MLSQKSDLRKYNKSQAIVKNYDKFDEKPQWADSNLQIPLFNGKDSSNDQSSQIQPIKGQDPIDSEIYSDIERIQSTKNKNEQKQIQKAIEEEQDKILQEHSIKKLIISNGHKNFVSEMFDTQNDSKLSVQDIENQTQLNQPKEKVMKIKNIDWFDSYIWKSIEGNRFDINEITLDECSEIHENIKIQDSEFNNSPTSNEGNLKQKELKVDHIKEFINQTLADKKDWLIRYNEIDALLKFIKSRFRDFRKNKHIDEFFKSASFTFYILTLNLSLPSAFFYRIIDKYEEITYENTIKLIIRWKIFYQARELLFEIIKMISEREYSAALVQTEIATIDSVDQIDQPTADHLKSSLKILLDQSNFIYDKIQQFKNIKPFDRPFVYKGDEYIKTMKEYYGMLNRVLQIHDIDLDTI